MEDIIGAELPRLKPNNLFVIVQDIFSEVIAKKSKNGSSEYF